jgi:hypothetical protein
MKIKAILATLLVAAVASADARFAWPYPRKTISPDETGHWVVINGSAWHNSAERSSGAAPKNRGKDFTPSEMSIFECLR